MAKGIFSRMADIIKANITDLLNRAEDPENMIRQMILEMEEAVNKATASVGTAVANEKRLERQYLEKKDQIGSWQKKAELAVQAGEDDLARRALERKAALEEAVRDLRAALDESGLEIEVKIETRPGGWPRVTQPELSPCVAAVTRCCQIDGEMLDGRQPALRAVDAPDLPVFSGLEGNR